MIKQSLSTRDTSVKPFVRTRLREMALAQGPDGKLPTIVELSRTLGTSRTTIEDVLDELQEQQVIYKRHGSGIYVSQKLFQNHIALIFGTWIYAAAEGSPFWGGLWSYFIKEAQRRNSEREESFSIHALLQNGENEEQLDRQLNKMMSNGQVNGVLGIGLNAETYRWIARHNLPSVSFAGFGQWEVEIAMHEVARLGVSLLAGQGCRAIRYWLVGNTFLPLKTDTESYQPDPAGVETYREALREAGLPYREELIWSNDTEPVNPVSHVEQGYRMMHRLFEEGLAGETDGLIINDDMMTLGALRALRQLGADRECRFRIATHANKGIPILHPFDDLTTRLEVDTEEIVSTMFRVLDSVLSGQSPESLTWIKLNPSG